MSNTDSITPVEHGRILVNAIQKRDVKSSSYQWELADLTRTNTRTQGQHGKSQNLTVSEWAKEIGWTALGRSTTTLRKMAAESRAWPEEDRLPNRSFWQHYEARDMHKDVGKARAWLLTRSETANITEEAREDILGNDSISEAILQLIKARKRILTVPAKLAKGEIRGTETNFERLRFEVSRLHKALDYLDRFLADEMEFDMKALDEAINRILAEEVS